MNPNYPDLSYLQPKNPWATNNLNFGRFLYMREIDPEAFGRRLLQRRKKLRLSQTALGKLAGYSQSRIDGLEKGHVKRPDRVASMLAEALQTTREWLLWEEGEEEIGPVVLTTPLLVEKYEESPRLWKIAITQLFRDLEQNGSGTERKLRRPSK